MTTDATPPPPAPTGGRRQRRKEKKSPWQMDVSSLGSREKHAKDDAVERPPFQATLPQVDLLPREVVESLAAARIARWAIGCALILILGAGGLWWLQGSSIESAQGDLESAQQENTRLQADLARLAPVKQMYDQITRLQELVATTLAGQPQAAEVIRRFATATQAAAGVAVTNTQITYNGIPEAGGDLNACQDPDPFSRDVTVGCMTFNGVADSRQAVSDFLRALGEDPMFIGPFVTSSTSTATDGEAGGVAFSGTVGLTPETLSTPLTAEQLDALVQTTESAPESTTSTADAQ